MHEFDMLEYLDLGTVVLRFPMSDTFSYTNRDDAECADQCIHQLFTTVYYR